MKIKYEISYFRMQTQRFKKEQLLVKPINKLQYCLKEQIALLFQKTSRTSKQSLLFQAHS